ncbi:unnamed protein product [Strongylus vulgaris]|uniref:Uncharacterized protein n=1 Tax=Strongylus vulgaris TaxID=40348 RepID=A0A3P7JBQ8_STRVU|nr:unnamed protein product [Strongylus vulgaris]
MNKQNKADTTSKERELVSFLYPQTEPQFALHENDDYSITLLQHFLQRRQHLIDSHAKFVAKAFLYPDLSCSIHYWLMACVEYGTPPNDPMISQICSTAEMEPLAATVLSKFSSGNPSIRDDPAKRAVHPKQQAQQQQVA